MRITDVKINGIRNPVGFSFDSVRCSWKVVDTKSKYQKSVSICVFSDEECTNLLYEKTGEKLDSKGEKIDLELSAYTRYFLLVSVDGEKDKAVSEISYFETGKMNETWQAEWIGTKKEDTFHPIFMHEFRTICTGKGIVNARMYVSGLGVYETYLNGQKVGEDYLAPFCNDYSKAIQYQTYDVTNLIQEDNVWEIWTGNGWYKGRLSFDGTKEYYGNRFLAIAELYLTYADGTTEIVKTDEKWKYKKSPIVDSDLYDGEVIDYRILQNVKYDKVEICKLETPLVERYSLPVIVKEELLVKEVIQTPAGETVLDFGQNFAGYVEFKADFSKGQRISLDFGEILQNGNFYNENYRSAKAHFEYISDGKNRRVRPHFTYYGFRYVKVTGWLGEISKEDFVGKVIYSDLDNTSKFSCSNDKLNRLFLNAWWGQKSNFIDMPTDCPQRDERLGWTGDTQVFAPTACFYMDTRRFYEKYLYDLRLDQIDHKGKIANYLPNLEPDMSGSCFWGDVATFLPMTLYRYYGDKEALERYYPMMKDWVEYVRSCTKKADTGYLWKTGFHFADWLALDGLTDQSMKGATEDAYVASMCYYKSVSLVAKAAEILGLNVEAAEYLELANNIYQSLLDEYFAPNGRLAQDTQTGYLLSLRFGVYRNKEVVIEGLHNRLKKDGYKIKGGFVGGTTICQILAENGLEDCAYHFLLQEGFPGWMRCVNLGATTIWERWNSVLDDGRISGTGMNSLNHYAYGSVMEYVFCYIAGIQKLEPGFSKVKFAPQINGKLRYVDYTYNSVSGNYASYWKINEDSTVTVRFEVPFGCSAVAYLPGTKLEPILLDAGVYENTYRPEVDYNKKYTRNSRLEELCDDEEVLKILKERLPQIYGIVCSRNPEFLYNTLAELKYLSFMGLNEEIVTPVVDEILKISYV